MTRSSSSRQRRRGPSSLPLEPENLWAEGIGQLLLREEDPMAGWRVLDFLWMCTASA